MEYKIEKNILLPPSERKGNAKYKYPFKQMEVGDSFLIKDYPKRKNGSPQPMAHTNSQKLVPMKFKQRLTDDGLRIWRVE